jgi:hypothetical protein
MTINLTKPSQYGIDPPDHLYSGYDELLQVDEELLQVDWLTPPTHVLVTDLE